MINAAGEFLLAEFRTSKESFALSIDRKGSRIHAERILRSDGAGIVSSVSRDFDRVMGGSNVTFPPDIVNFTSWNFDLSVGWRESYSWNYWLGEVCVYSYHKIRRYF